MLLLNQLNKNDCVTGIEPGQIVRIVSIELTGDSTATVYYKTSEGLLKERMLFKTDEINLALATNGRPWSFDASGQAFKLAVEAYRINLAYLFDPMMAVHTSDVEPYPHQITAVYEAMLPRQPLRFVLADDPGAGKTIMAGLLIRELVMRADAKKVLIVSPGSLVDQWQDELARKFGMDFEIVDRSTIERSPNGNPFERYELLIARLDQLSRNEDIQEKLRASYWDLVIVDEAHKLAAHYYGNEIKKSKRYELGELLGASTRHFLLMTATPHNGKEEDFQLFMALLDTDRFYGKFRDGAHKVDVSDLMRRMVKEDLLTFEGAKLFPERRAITASYQLSNAEVSLYHAVTQYVKEEMNKADQLDGKRKGTVGFALTILQRRLASSPEAIYQSLKRRRLNLSRKLEEARLHQRGVILADAAITSTDLTDVYDTIDDYRADEFEALEEQVADQATAARTVAELEHEISVLAFLEEQALGIRNAEQDCKWEKLRELLQNTPEMLDAEGRQRKLILFTEHRDTLIYLTQRIRTLLGNPKAVVEIHGGTKREDRRKVQELFRNDPETRILVATDAAGEGVNLQNANLMVNYDLPWNPNRLEQRFGRIHRIGQTQICHLWNLLAGETAEGHVFQTLLNKLEVESKALGGRVYDILGEVFDNVSLKDLLVEAIRYGDDPEVRARQDEKVQGALDTSNLKALIKRNALCEQVFSDEHLFQVKAEMEKATARKLQPYFIQAFFRQAFEHLGGELRPREGYRYEISHVPAMIRERDRVLSGRDSSHRDPVVTKYGRICFEKSEIDRNGKPRAALIHPGHPLMQAVVDLIQEQHRGLLKQGTVLLDPNDPGTEPKVLFLLDHAVKDGSDPESKRALSRRIQFVEIASDGQARFAGWGPHLDYESVPDEDRTLLKDVMAQPWLTQNLEQLALDYAASKLVPEHYHEVKTRREQTTDKIHAAVHERLAKEIAYYEDRYLKLKEDVAAGKQPRMQPENARRTMEELIARLNQRTSELQAMRHVVSAPPIVVGGALIVPAGLMAQLKGIPSEPVDMQARRLVELAAMRCVCEAEEALGHSVTDVSADKVGWDLTSQPPRQSLPNGQSMLPMERHIEVKGRQKGQPTLTVTRNEILYGLNQKEKFILAIVLVDGQRTEGPFYISQPFSKEPETFTTSVNLEISDLLARAVPPAQVPVIIGADS